MIYNKIYTAMTVFAFVALLCAVIVLGADEKAKNSKQPILKLQLDLLRKFRLRFTRAEFIFVPALAAALIYLMPVRAIFLIALLLEVSSLFARINPKRALHELTVLFTESSYEGK